MAIWRLCAQIRAGEQASGETRLVGHRTESSEGFLAEQSPPGKLHLVIER